MKYLKTFIQLLACITICFTITSTSHAHEYYNGIKVTICEPDYLPVSYCNKRFMNRLKQKVKEPPNFDNGKYLIITKLPGSAYKERFEYYFAVFDPKKKTLYPLTLALTHFSDDQPPKIIYFKDSPNICVNGNVISYRNAYEDVIGYCYHFDEEFGDALLINNIDD